MSDSHKGADRVPRKPGRSLKSIGLPNFRAPRARLPNEPEPKIPGRMRRSKGHNPTFATPRRYRIVLTSMSDPTALIDIEIYATSLMTLMRSVVYQMGTINHRHVARHFSVTFTEIQPMGETQTEVVPIVEGHSSTSQSAAPIVSDQPIDQELEL